ncbi:MAG: NADH-quinone oxidoreductase subunit L [Elusimicrobia bacterium]|nr:NADH-quinone oxidoreductase subunit L [Elusimicrobiota bacterium]
MENINPILLLIFTPIIFGLLILFIPNKLRGFKEVIAFLVTAFCFVLAIYLFKSKEIYFSVPWIGYGIDFQLRLYNFSQFTLLFASGFIFLVTLYSTTFMYDKNYLNQYYSYLLLTLGFSSGVVLADNLVVMLFFWEGLLLTTFGTISIGNKNAYKTAIKAFLIIGITDLCLMLGIGLVYYITGTLTISKISIPLTTSLSAAAFTFMMIGAIAKGGSMPFHSWIPDAAIDAPLPFMAFLPASLEKLLGIYLLTRITLNLFQMTPGSWVSLMLMIIGAVTILLAVMMALVQKDFKRLLSYHAISQFGYMVLGIGTAVPVGIVGGIFHMINNALYKSCLFLTGGAVEKQTGTTNLENLGGLGRKMPVTFICFAVTAIAISGVPPLNGFFSKELVMDGALERHWIFYVAALVGSFFTAASFLKLGHSAFLGKLQDQHKNVKEVPLTMLFPMIIIAFVCILFGLYNSLPIKHMIQPLLGEHLLEGKNFAGFPSNLILVGLTVITLAGALINHIYGVKRTGKGIGAIDHIHYAPVLNQIYNLAEKRFFDPYDIALKIVNIIAKISFFADRAIDWLYNGFSVGGAYLLSTLLRKSNTGSYSSYIVWSLVGIFCIFVFSLF